MLSSVSGVIGMAAYCLTRVFKLPPQEAEDKLHAQPGIETESLE
jgi:hypothetical protein